MMRVYLAGPIGGISYKGATDWRQYATDRLLDLGVKAHSPMRDTEQFRNRRKMPLTGDFPLAQDRGITLRDKFDVMRSDALLVNLVGADAVSRGTMIELGWADAYNKPLVTAMEQGNCHDHPMVRETGGIIVPTLDEAIETLISILDP